MAPALVQLGTCALEKPFSRTTLLFIHNNNFTNDHQRVCEGCTWSHAHTQTLREEGRLRTVLVVLSGLRPDYSSNRPSKMLSNEKGTNLKPCPQQNLFWNSTLRKKKQGETGGEKWNKQEGLNVSNVHRPQRKCSSFKCVLFLIILIRGK